LPPHSLPLPIQVHNSLSGKKEAFEPLVPGQVKMYVCGITPYDECHLGHARCYVTFDFIRRALRRLGYAVTCVQNFTDIDDKIIQRAQKVGESPNAVAERYIEDYFRQMDRLYVQRADAYPRVTQHMPQIMAFIERILKNGSAYTVDGDVYFSVRKSRGYGKLSKRSLDDLQSGARVEVDARKQDPLDFALWKSAKPGEPSWDSPWGPGRPGWHIECSVMSLVNLKTDTFDIHGGGEDLKFPHHENEIAQAEAATGRPFARVWIHNGFVTVNQEKMSKSLGNFFTLSQIFKSFDPRAVKLLLLQHHYRTPLEFSTELLEIATETWRNLESTFQRVSAVLKTPAQVRRREEKNLETAVAQFEEKLAQALADDFHSPRALAALFDLVDELKTRTDSSKKISTPGLKKGFDAAIQALDEVFGLPVSMPGDAPDAGVDELVRERERARQARDWPEADRLRKALADMNVVVEDTPKGPRWWKKT
jgi:cysteinyl-tRNA synthetase